MIIIMKVPLENVQGEYYNITPKRKIYCNYDIIIFLII
jgi:hypothetical protein